MMILSVLLAGLPAARADQKPDIVVKGYAPRELKASIDACVTRRCSDADYANTVLAAANTAFVNGDYTLARTALDAAVRHFDKDKASAKFRVAVFQAQSVVAEHQGDRRDAEGAYRRAVYALAQEGASGSADEVKMRLDLGELYKRAGRSAEAREAFASAARVAEAMGSDDLRAAVEIHRAILDYQQGGTRAPIARLQAVVDSLKPLMEMTRTAAAIAIARIARAGGDLGPTNALIAKVARRPSAGEPLLLFAPPIQDPADALRDPNFPSQRFIPIDQLDHDDIRWADIGYWIRPDGRVEDVEALRGSSSREWTKPILSSIGRRVYTASTGAENTNGYYVVERFTIGYPLVTPAGTLIPRRAGLPTLTELRLVAGDAPPPPDGRTATPVKPPREQPALPVT